jgi:hypothetical protein
MKSATKLLFLFILGFLLQSHSVFAVVAKTNAATTIAKTLDNQQNIQSKPFTKSFNKAQNFLKKKWHGLIDGIDKSTKTGKFLWFTIVFWGVAVAASIVVATLPESVLASIIGAVSVIFYVAGIFACIKWLLYLIAD